MLLVPPYVRMALLGERHVGGAQLLFSGVTIDPQLPVWSPPRRTLPRCRRGAMRSEWYGRAPEPVIRKHFSIGLHGELVVASIGA